MKKKYNVIDLFAGAGGLSLGFLQTKRFNIVAAAENNQNARKTYMLNHRNTKLYSDVRAINYNEIKTAFGDVDVVIGGPPCQGFSNANRQRSTIISMNNRLVKEYVRAICELEPTAFVMENVAMLRSNVHRFIVDEDDLKNEIVSKLDLSLDNIELIPAGVDIPNILDFCKDTNNIDLFSWDEKLYKIITVLYRYRINKTKFDNAIEKHKKELVNILNNIDSDESSESEYNILALNHEMSRSLGTYIENQEDFDNVIKAIEPAILIQRLLRKMNEITENNIHVFDYIKSDSGAINIVVKSYAVFDYIKGVLDGAYNLTPMTLNAADYGAPQKRERFVIVGISNTVHKTYNPPKEKITDGKYNTVRDAIADLEDVPAYYDINTPVIHLQNPDDNICELGKKLRGKLLYNHISTATRETALERFKALKEGQNFHDLTADMKTTYSNAERTQNTIYLRLTYDEPSGTVVNVRKSMWVHPTLDRAISIREAARLQTFPDTFRFEGTKDSQYQQVGNAVPPMLAKAIAKSVLKVLDD